MKLGVLASHTIQYQAPLFRELAGRVDLQVFFAHRQSAIEQAQAGFSVPFDWDTDLSAGYTHRFLSNVASNPGTATFWGCDNPEVADVIAAGKFDAFLVMGWHLKCYWQAIRACHSRGVPVLVRGDSQLGTPRSLIKQTLKRVVYPGLLRQFTALLYVGTRNKQYLRHYGVPPERLFFSPHCVDNHYFAERAARISRETARTTWGDGQAALYVGKLLDGKRAQDLINALALLRKAGTRAFGVIAGDGPCREALEARGRELKVPLVFLGFRNQTELPAVYAAADVLVLPSASETWGLVVNEALACGTPCVVSDACGCAPDLIVPGVSGNSYPVGDIHKLADAIRDALSIPRANSGLRSLIDGYSPAAAAQGILMGARHSMDAGAVRDPT